MRLRISRSGLLMIVLLGCAGAGAQKFPVALKGTIVAPDGVLNRGTVLIQNGLVLAAGTQLTLPAGVKVIETDAVIAPGLIDLHNHLTWNIFPRWRPSQEFGNRYDWQQKPAYNVLMTVPHKKLVEEGLECDMERYAEIKAITEGETSVTGSLHAACVHGLARNLDEDAELTTPHGRLIYNVFPFQMSEAELAEAKVALEAKPRGALLIHVAEGAPHDAAATREFQMLKGRGLLMPGVSIIHGVALQPPDFAAMAEHGVGFVWSPRSNIELYGDTADVAAARTAGVTMALAPDWSPTGSDGLLGELNYASVWNQTQVKPPFRDSDLVAMATANAAKLAGLQDELGSLATGHAADLIVVRRRAGEKQDAYWTLTHATPQALELVLVGGVAMYGDRALVEKITTQPLEPMEVCGTAKVIPLAGHSYAEIEAELDTAMNQYGRKLAPLSECGQ